MQLPVTLVGVPPWRVTLFDGYCESFADTTELFFSEAIEPACVAFSAKVGPEPLTPAERTNARLDAWEDLRVAELEMHRSFALGLAAMWERHFRQILWNAACIILGDQRKPALAKVERGDWKNLCTVFDGVRGFPLTKFPMYDDLELLHRIASAVRHGTGPASLWVYTHRKDLFMPYDVRSGFYAYFTLGGEEDHSINKLDIPLAQLRIFKDAIVGFWRLIELLRRDHAEKEQ